MTIGDSGPCGRGAGDRGERGRGDRPAAGDRRRGADGGGAVPGVLREADREREDAGGVRESGGAIPGVGARREVSGSMTSRRSTWLATSGRTPVGADGEAALGRDPHAWRLARGQPGSPGEPGRGGAGSEARRHQGRDARALAGGKRRKLLERIDTGTLAGLRDQALLSVMLYSFARVSAVLGMWRQDYFGQGSRGWLRLHGEGWEAARRPGAPPGSRRPRRLRRGGRARGAEGPRSSKRWTLRGAS